MRKGVLVVLLVFGVVFSGRIAWADSSATAGASANANAGAASFASGGSASAHVSNLNVNAPQTEIGVGVEVNPGQTVAPETTSSVSIDSHAKYIQVNRQFLSLPIGGNPMGGTMQDFLPPKAFGYPWNFSPVLEGTWKQKGEIKKIKIKEMKEYCYRKLKSQKKVTVVANHKVLIEGEIIGEIKIKAAESEDSLSIQMAAIDRLASWGANVIWVRVNALEHEAKSSYSGFILGGGAGGVMASQEKVATSGSGGIGKGSSRLSFLHYPVVHATGYRGKLVEVKKEIKKEVEEKAKSGNGKKWQAIQ